MTGRVWRIASNNTYSCGLHNIGHLLHTLPTTCLMQDSNLSTHGHIRREYHRPNFWQSRASFIEVNICVYRCTNHTFFHLSLCRKHFFHSHQTLFHYRKFGQRDMLSLWRRSSRLGCEWRCFCRTCKMVALLCVRHIRKGKTFHWWMSANSPPIRHWGHSHCSIEWVNKFHVHREPFLLH